MTINISYIKVNGVITDTYINKKGDRMINVLGFVIVVGACIAFPPFGFCGTVYGRFSDDGRLG